MNGVVPNVALKFDKEERVYALDYEQADITEQERTSTDPEDIHKYIHAGVLPAYYEGTAISVELQGRSEISCFTLNKDGTVTCPMGNVMIRLTMRGDNTIYANKDACRQCPHRCTGGKSFKTVSYVIASLQLLIILAQCGMALGKHFAFCDKAAIRLFLIFKANVSAQEILAEGFLLRSVNVNGETYPEGCSCQTSDTVARA